MEHIKYIKNIKNKHRDCIVCDKELKVKKAFKVLEIIGEIEYKIICNKKCYINYLQSQITTLQRITTKLDELITNMEKINNGE